jgi:hypothetical protein
MPSIARRKRLERLEARQPKGRPYFDAFPAAIALWGALEAEHAAERARREFRWVSRPDNRCPKPRKRRWI